MVNPWVEHVKRKAKELNTSYGCAITMKEVKDSYKKVEKKKKAVKPRRKTEQKRMGYEDVNVALKDANPSKEDIERVKKAIAKFRKMKEDKTISDAKKKKIQSGIKKLKEYIDKKSKTIRTEKNEKKMKEVLDNFNETRLKILKTINQLDEKQLKKFKNLSQEQLEKLFGDSGIKIDYKDKSYIDRKVAVLEKKRERLKKEAEQKAKQDLKKEGKKPKKISKEQLEKFQKFKEDIKDLANDDEPFKIFGIDDDEDLQELSDNLIEDMGGTFEIQNVAETYADGELKNTDVIKMINDYLEGGGEYGESIDKDVKKNYDELSNIDQVKLVIISVNNLLFGGDLEDVNAIRSIFIPKLSSHFKKNLKSVAKTYEISGLKL